MLSIIVPVFNEVDAIEPFINYIHNEMDGHDVELLLIDGGSTDGTLEICQDKSVTVHKSKITGRAAQMNKGASLAKGEVLYFLHVDSLPPNGFISQIEKHIKGGLKAGCFQLSFVPTHPILKVYAWFTRFNLTIFRFGDQSLFVARKEFEVVGGFDEDLVVMEDQKLVRELKKITRFYISSKKIKTSSRKYFTVGVIKLQLIFTAILCMYYLGTPQNILVKLYKKLIGSM